MDESLDGTSKDQVLGFNNEFIISGKIIVNFIRDIKVSSVAVAINLLLRLTLCA